VTTLPLDVHADESTSLNLIDRVIEAYRIDPSRAWFRITWTQRSNRTDRRSIRHR